MAAIAVNGFQQGQPAGVWKRRGAEQDCVQHTEDGGVHSDAKSQSDQHNERESGTLAKLPESEPGVIPERHAWWKGI
jgi:hypothetical protein